MPEPSFEEIRATYYKGLLIKAIKALEEEIMKDPPNIELLRARRTLWLDDLNNWDHWTVRSKHIPMHQSPNEIAYIGSLQRE